MARVSEAARNDEDDHSYWCAVHIPRPRVQDCKTSDTTPPAVWIFRVTGPFADFIPRVLGDHPILARLEMVGADHLLKDLDVRPIPIRERVVSGAFEEQLDQQREGKGAE